MNLKPEEYDLIRNRMLNFRIPYQEVYLELMDHLSSDIENKRNDGDMREVEVLLQEAINQMGGAAGIEKMAREHENLFRVKIDNRIAKFNRKHILWKSLGAALFCVLADQLVPDNSVCTIALYALIVLIIVAVAAFLNYSMGSLPSIDQKKLLLRTNIFWQVWMPMTMLSAAFFIANIASAAGYHTGRTFIFLHPIIPLIIFYYTVLYLRACYRVMEEELQAVNA